MPKLIKEGVTIIFQDENDTSLERQRHNSEFDFTYYGLDVTIRLDNKSLFTGAISVLVNASDTPFTSVTLQTFLGDFNTGGGGGSTLDSEIIVKQVSDFVLPIDPDKTYVVDGSVDMLGTEIPIPEGIKLRGSNMEVSVLTDSTAGYVMFKKDGLNNSGGVFATDMTFTVSGVGSKLFDLDADTGTEAVEFSRVNFTNCTSLGEIVGYRQGLESGTGRFFSTPELTLSGTWTGGYFIDTSIVRFLDNGSYTLYKAGVGFSMGSRFRSNQNIDLPALTSFVDFSQANFPNPSTLDFESVRITRNGITDSSDINLTPNILQSDLASYWKNNQGLPNTFIGGTMSVTTEITTVIPGGNQGVFFDLEGTWSTEDLQHFDSPSNGQLRHLGDNPREFRAIVDLNIDCSSNSEVDVKVVVWDDSAASFVDYKTVRKVVNNFQGGRDVAFFNFNDFIFLDKNDYVKIMVANTTGTQNITAELNSEVIIEER